jgi:hypothetical protein
MPFDLSTHTQEIVLILISVGVTGALFLHIIDAKDYLVLAGMVFAFYFNNKANQS